MIEFIRFLSQDNQNVLLFTYLVIIFVISIKTIIHSIKEK